PALAPRADAALAPHARVLAQVVLGRRGHRHERVVDQVGAVAEDREAVPIGEQVAMHEEEPTPRAPASRGTRGSTRGGRAGISRTPPSATAKAASPRPPWPRASSS